jgi:adenylyltransferase/sulfurtransferase
MNNSGQDNSTDLDRYVRQVRFPGLGAAGQRRLLASRVLVVGCGALGSVIANTLARAGVGHLRIVDRDFLETNNLQRQVLFDEDDVSAGLPKAIAAANKLRKINSGIEIEPLVADVDCSNITGLCQDVDMILDGTDNFETRFLINDAAHKFSIPWVFGGCLGADGQTMTILPGHTPCLNCLMVEGPPPPGAAETCDSFGILAPIINVIASIQCSEAIKILSGQPELISRKMTIISLWDNQIRMLDVSSLREAVECPTCVLQEYRWLDGNLGSRTAVLCGRNAVQLSFPGQQELDLNSVASKLGGLGQIEQNRYLVRFFVDDYVLTLFPDGRAIISGTEDVSIAKKLYAQYVGA